VKAARRPAAPTGRRARKPVVVLGMLTTVRVCNARIMRLAVRYKGRESHV
jgi:hypothetical protein